ncbi:hypothetical protein, conserved [Leishmania tarentolae]|uniref:Uncharacterized protein n=1 Tax=Leishmania tarentolae TaxID=5689 RepID=A0A640KA98_LEITA|nr:hypothetical protein, conserved [Leishmania tarentolae]
MIPALNMNSIPRHTPVTIPAGGGSGGPGLNSSGAERSCARLATGQQNSPHTSYLTSPRETSSVPSAHLQRRAADVTSVLEMNPLQCHNLGDLQRKLIETAEWVVKLRHWYAHQLHERDVWYESRLRGLEDSFYAALPASTAAGTAHATAGAGAAHTATGNSFTEHAAPFTVPASRAVTSGAPMGSAIATTRSASADRETSSGTLLRHRSRTPQRSAAERSAAGIHPGSGYNSVRQNPLSSVGTTTGTAGGGNSPNGGSSTPLHAGPPKRSALVLTAQSRLASSAGSLDRQLLRQEGNVLPFTTVASTVIDRGESRPTLAARAVPVTRPVVVEDDSDAPGVAHQSSPSPNPRQSHAETISLASSSVGTQVKGIPSPGVVRLRRDAPSSGTPRSGRPSSANALLSAAGAATESSGCLSARAGGNRGRRSDAPQSELRRRYASLSRAGSGSITIISPQYDQFLDTGASRNPMLTDVSTGSRASDVATPAFHKTAPRYSNYLLLLTSGDDNHTCKPKRRSVSSSGTHRVSRVYTSSGVKQNAMGRGAPIQQRTGTQNTDVSRHSSPGCFTRERSWA